MGKNSDRESEWRQNANMWNYNYWSPVLQKAFPLSLNALLRRYCSPQQVDSSAAARRCNTTRERERERDCAAGSCLYEISISAVTECNTVTSSAVTWTTNNHFQAQLAATTQHISLLLPFSKITARLSVHYRLNLVASKRERKYVNLWLKMLWDDSAHL